MSASVLEKKQPAILRSERTLGTGGGWPWARVAVGEGKGERKGSDPCLTSSVAEAFWMNWSKGSEHTRTHDPNPQPRAGQDGKTQESRPAAMESMDDGWGGRDGSPQN